MSEHYPMWLTIGGRITKETFGVFCRLFRDAAHPFNPIPPLEEYLDDAGSFFHEDDDCNPTRFDELLELCQLRGLSFLCRCGSNGVESPDIYFWVPGMENPRWAPMDMDGHGFIKGRYLKGRLRAYAVSGAERMRGLEDMLPPEEPKIPAFEVINE